MVIFKFRNLNTSQATPIPPGEFTVGRSDDAYVHVEDVSVSRRHARIFNEDDGLFVEDAGSANGTATRGALIAERVKLEVGDIVHIGSVPFRVDPEVSAGAVAAPSAGLRMARRATLTRETEKIPILGATPRQVEAVPSEQLSAPEVSFASDNEAAELNAITMREPADPAPVRLPIIRPGTGGVPEEMSAQTVLPVPTPQNPALIRTAVSQKAYPSPPRPTPSTPLPHQGSVAPSDAVPATQVTGMGWGWMILIFLAGLGTGLLLGLYFAKLFLDLGGKAASLP